MSDPEPVSSRPNNPIDPNQDIPAIHFPGTEDEGGESPPSPTYTLLTLEKVFPVNGANWNDHIAKDFSVANKYESADQPCSYSVPIYYYDGCFHGAELLKAIIPGDPGCAGLVISDELQAFDWVCRQSGGSTTVYSLGLKVSKGLASLLDSEQWKSNRLLVSDGSSVVYGTNSVAWWTNPVRILPDSVGSEVVTLVEDSAIYTVPTTRSTNGIYIGATQKLALVIFPGAQLFYSGMPLNNCSSYGYVTTTKTFRTMICGNTPDYFWLEGHLSGDRSLAFNSTRGVTIGDYPIGITMKNVTVSNIEGDGVYWNGLAMSRNINFTAYGNTGVGMYDHYPEGNIHYNMVVANNGADGFKFFDGSHTSIVNAKSYNNGGDGFNLRWVYASNQSYMSYVNLLSVNNAGHGIRVDDGEALNLLNVTSANNQNHGFDMKGAYSSNLVSLLIFSNGDDGIKLYNWGNDNQFSQLVSGNNTGVGFSLADQDNNVFFDNFLVGNNGFSDCLVANGANPGIDNACNSTANLVSGVSLSGSFAGLLTSDDSINSSDVNGLAAFTGLTDWIGFENFYRNWGIAAADLAIADGSCTSGSCQIADWSLLSSDLKVRNTKGDGATQLAAFVAGGPCPSLVDGNKYMTIPGYTFEVMGDGNGDEDGRCDGGESCYSPEYLVNATEIILDSIGNDNGLCESGEACLYSPNFGVYQGHGDYLTPGSCVFNDGVILGVTMYAYPVNGE